MECFLGIFAFIALVIGIVIYFSVVTARKANEAWQAAAEELRLDYEPGAWNRSRVIKGTFLGQWVRVDVYTTGGKNSQTFTRYVVHYPESLGLGLRLHRQGFFSNLWQMVAGHDIEVGDKDFDADVVIKGKNPDAVIDFLTPRRRERIHALLLDQSGCTIDDEKIHWQAHGLVTNPEKIIKTVRRMCKVARALAEDVDDEEAGAAPEVLPVSPHYEQPPEVVPVKPYYQDFPPAVPVSSWDREDSPQEPRPEETPVAAREEAISPVVPDRQEPAIPEPAAVSPAPPAEQPAAVESPVSAYDDGVAGPSAAEVCNQLFRGDQMTHRIVEQFEQNYKDKPIMWSGILQEVSTFFFDMQFSNQNGTRAAFEVHEVPGLFGTSKVQAVVQLPPGLESTLREQIGQRLTFAGRLIACDAFLRRLFVAEGRLV